jgi:putative flippase GtrA
MQMQLSRTDLQMWLRWVVASTAGLVLGLLMASGIMTVGYENYKLLSAALGGAVFGVCLTSVQMLSIGQYVKMGRWIVAGVVGYSLGFVLMYLVNDFWQFGAWAAKQERSFPLFGVYSVVVSLAVGLPVGILQWWNFRHGSVSLAGWVLTSMLAIGISIFIALFIAWIVNTDQSIGGLEIPAILLPLAGIFSTFSWLPVFRSRETRAPQKELMDTPALSL